MPFQQLVGVGMLVLLVGLGLLVVGLQYVPHHWGLTAHRVVDLTRAFGVLSLGVASKLAPLILLGVGFFWRAETMVKETKFFRKQADKAERMARIASDDDISQRYLNMARAYRTQAEVLKAKKKAVKKAR